MNIINSVALIFCLFLSTVFYAQSKDTLQGLKRANFMYHDSASAIIDQPSVLKNINFQKLTPTLVLYNKTTNMYNAYWNNNGSFSFSSKATFRNRSNFFTTLFLGNDSFIESNTAFMQNRSFLLDEDTTYQVRDSFNPYGASNINEALIGGVLGLLFN